MSITTRGLPGIPLSNLDLPTVGADALQGTVPVQSPLEEVQAQTQTVDPRQQNYARQLFLHNLDESIRKLQEGGASGTDNADLESVNRMLQGMGIPDIPANGQMGADAQQAQQQQILQALKAMGFDVGDTWNDPRTQDTLKQLQQGDDSQALNSDDMSLLAALLMALASQRASGNDGGQAPSVPGMGSGGGGVRSSGGGAPTGRTGNGGASGTGATQGTSGTGPAPSGQVGQWIEQARQELIKAGVPADKMDPSDIAAIIQHESSGDPNAVNNWDSNAAAGTPSKGLMQCIQPTFDSYKLPGHDNIMDPVDNIIAGVRYAIDRYGSVSNVPGLTSMRSGGNYRGY